MIAIVLLLGEIGRVREGMDKELRTGLQIQLN